jgi:hypothetical protein
LILAAHQPHYLPWLGYLDKIRRADKFLIVDHVQFERKNFQNRTRVPAPSEPEGWRWLTVPVVQTSRDETILEKRLAEDTRWRRKHCLALEQIYRAAPYYALYGPRLRGILEADWSKLLDLNVSLLQFFLDVLEIRTPLGLTSEMGPIPGQKSDFVLNMCRMAGATTYLSGEGGSREYLDLEAFRVGGVDIQWQSFKHPDYPRGEGEKQLRGITALDLIFYCGPASAAILAGEGGRAETAAAAMIPTALVAGAALEPAELSLCP